jgi:hypothetical protein
MRRAPSPARLPPAAAVLGKTVKKRAVSTAAEPGACRDGRLYGHERPSKYAADTASDRN